MKQSMNKSAKMIISALAAGAFTIILSTGIALAEAEKGEAEMVLQTAKAKKPAVFPHAKHQAVLDCAECHHGKNENGSQAAYVEGSAIGKCESCHNPEDMKNTNLNNFKNAAHANCKDCHKEMAKAGKPTGPTKCNGCHVSS